MRRILCFAVLAFGVLGCTSGEGAPPPSSPWPGACSASTDNKSNQQSAVSNQQSAEVWSRGGFQSLGITVRQVFCADC